MRRIELNNGEKLQAKAVIEGIVAYPDRDGSGGFKVAELKKRMRILDALEKSAGGALLLEDADYEHLMRLLDKVEFNQVNRDLMSVIEAIETADVMQATARPAS